MTLFSTILSALQAAIAARAARDRALTVLLVAVWGRIARMRVRLERLVAQWRAATLPKTRALRAGQARTSASRPAFPTTPGWLIKRMREAVPYGTQLEHFIAGDECAAFLAAVPQAGRILRPLCRMLGVEQAAPVIAKRAQKPVAAWVTVPSAVAQSDEQPVGGRQFSSF